MTKIKIKMNHMIQYIDIPPHLLARGGGVMSSTFGAAPNNDFFGISNVDFLCDRMLPGAQLAVVRHFRGLLN